MAKLGKDTSIARDDFGNRGELLRPGKSMVKNNPQKLGRENPLIGIWSILIVDNFRCSDKGMF